LFLHLQMSVVIDILGKDEKIDPCCICLHTYNDSETIQLLDCCKQHIHKKCIFKVVLHGHVTCPLCRSTLQPQAYFDDEALELQYKKLPINEKIRYSHDIKRLLYTVSTKHRVRRFVSVMYSSILQHIFFLFMLIMFNLFIVGYVYISTSFPGEHMENQLPYLELNTIPNYELTY
jgi:hypothetical protein